MAVFRKKSLGLSISLCLSAFACASFSNAALANQAPITMSQSNQVKAGEMLNAWVWGNDPEGQKLYYELVTTTAHGKLQFNNYKGTFTYTVTSPSAKYDEFKFRVSDGKQYSNISVVQLIIEPSKTVSKNNAPPKTLGQSNYVTAGQLLKSHAWGEDADKDKLTYTVVSWPKYGQLRLDPQSGDFTYFSNQNVAKDIFSFRVNDGQADSNVSQVHLLFTGNTTTNKPTTPTKPKTTSKPTTPTKPKTPTINKPTKPTNPEKPKTTNPTQSVYPSSWTSKNDFPALVQRVLNTNDTRLFYNDDFNHVSTDGLSEIFQALAFLADQNDIADKDLQQLFTYLRGWNYSREVKNIKPSVAKIADQALMKVTQMSDFYTVKPDAAAALEGYVVALNGYIRIPETDSFFAKHVDILNQLVDHLVSNADSVNGTAGYSSAIFELTTTIDILGFQVAQPSKTGSALKSALLATNLPESIAELGKRSALGIWSDRYGRKDPFILMNAIEALGNLFIDNENSWNKRLDNAAISLIKDHNDYSDQKELKANFYSYYVTKTRKSNPENSCSTEFANFCYQYKISEVLPYTHQCSSSLTLRYQQLDTNQVNEVCQRLKRQEYEFHSLMATNWKPVDEDNNTDLELVIFNESSEYKKFGALLYKIATNNGGIYIEGEPNQANNQARLFVYERPNGKKWDIWNLNHEYVHYLDGRFDLYGRFAYYPLNKTTWWTEGLAEFIAWRDDFPRGMNDVSSVSPSARPSLQQIVNMDYSSGTSMVYHWSYTLHRFLQERHSAEHLKLAEYLRSNQLEAYNSHIQTLASNYASEYQQWLGQLISNWKQANPYAMGDQVPAESGSRPHTEHNHMPTVIDQASTARPPLSF
ncbi:collagenase [Zooshikella marina]|uniref:collagenase n=1 Tax=Zooshikella ganghwensis TaxID=202772 RepID=UPI001BAF2F5F|nr:collagenase [Zooshikella ganghwensis]MBU2708417.1 collagenase [Zooshikella ganghwensis]